MDPLSHSWRLPCLVWPVHHVHCKPLASLPSLFLLLMDLVVQGFSLVRWWVSPDPIIWVSARFHRDNNDQASASPPVSGNGVKPQLP